VQLGPDRAHDLGPNLLAASVCGKLARFDLAQSAQNSIYYTGLIAMGIYTHHLLCDAGAFSCRGLYVRGPLSWRPPLASIGTANYIIE